MNNLLLFAVASLASYCILMMITSKNKYTIPWSKRGCFGGDSEAENVAMPAWYEDPYYQKTQDKLFGYGTDILEGNLPDFYSSLGRTGSPAFKEMLALVNRDTARAVNENLVRRNITRGGVGVSSIAKATADVGSKLRFEDFLRANREKAGLLTTGLNTVSGVRSAALDITGKRNQFNLGRTELELGRAGMMDEAEAAQNQMWSDILSSAIGAGAIIATGGFATPVVAGAGGAGALGSAEALNPGIMNWGNYTLN